MTLLSKIYGFNVKNLQSQNFQPFLTIVTVMVRTHIFFTFFNKIFQNSQNWTFLKCPKKNFRNTFVYSFFNIFASY